MAEEALFEWRLTGQGLEPGKLPAPVMGELIIAISESLTSLMKEQNPKLDPEESFIALTEVEAGSIRFKFTSPNAFLAVTAFATLTVAIQTKTFETLPRKTLEGLDRVVKIARRRGYDSELIPRGRGPSAAQIRAEENIDVFDSQFIRGSTELYGKLVRMGGEGSNASVKLRLHNGDTMTCACHERLVRKLLLNNKLYEIIGLSGIAKWNPTTLELVEFRAHELLAYEDTDIVTAFDRLREATAGAYDDVDDVEAYIQELRGA